MRATHRLGANRHASGNPYARLGCSGSGQGRFDRHGATRGDGQADEIVRRRPTGLGAFELHRVGLVGPDTDHLPGFELDGSIYRLLPNDATLRAQLAMARGCIDTECVPDYLKCPVTNRLIRAPVILPCCGRSVSADAVLVALAPDAPDVEGGTCRLCRATGVFADHAIPNRVMRGAIQAFFDDVKHAKADEAAAEAAQAAAQAGEAAAQAAEAGAKARARQ